MDERTAALSALEERFDRSLEELIEFARIPGVSAQGFDPDELDRSAEHTAALLRSAGLEDVEVIRLPGVHPYAVGGWAGAPGSAPTALIYAHHDVQPPGRSEKWQTPAFEPTVRADGRLYGRGVADDKAGLLMQLAAIRAWLEATGSLPLNVKLVVEGEEEIGSPHLATFLRQQRDRVAADVLVLSDTANLLAGLPSLTTSLRGLVSVDLSVRVLDHPLHSGVWGGPILDAGSALARLLARLVDDAGVIAIPGLYDTVAELEQSERARLARLPFDEVAFRSDAGFLPSGQLAGEQDYSVYERLWLRPSLAVIALDGVPLAQSSNQLMDEARARISLRLAPQQDPERVVSLLVDFLRQDPPCGAELSVEVVASSPGWSIDPSGPAFDAARRALAAGFECEPVEIGCGGTIPCVGPFCEVLGGIPALLLGLEDPVCNAHGENESLNLTDFRKAARSAVHMLDELSHALR